MEQFPYKLRVILGQTKDLLSKDYFTKSCHSAKLLSLIFLVCFVETSCLMKKIHLKNLNLVVQFH